MGITSEELTKQGLGDFRNFLFLVWKHLCLPEPTEIQYDIAEYLQYGPKRLICEAYRGAGKSWTSSALAVFLLRHNPNLKILVVSASKARSDDFSIFTLRLISELSVTQDLYPLESQRNSRIAFDVAPARAAHAPSVKSVGIFGQMTGSRADVIIADDIEVPNNSDTEEKREKLFNAALEFESILSPGGRIIFLGTPQTEASIYNRFRQRGYSCRIWPVRYPLKAKMSAYEGLLSPFMETSLDGKEPPYGAPTDPKRFSELDLMEREAAYGKSGFALQFMLDTTLSDSERYPLKTSDLVVLDTPGDKSPITLSWCNDPVRVIKDLPNIGFSGDRFYRPLFIDDKWDSFEGSAMAIDPSGRGTDELGYAVVKQAFGNLYITASGGLKGGYSDDNLVKLAQIAFYQKVNYIVIESNFGDGMFTKIFTPILAKIHPCTLEEVRHNIQKEKRIIDTLEPVMNQHRLIIDGGVIREDLKMIEEGDTQRSLIYQMTHITRDRGALKHDDRLDALAMIVSYWVESLGRDRSREREAYDDRELDKSLKAFMEGTLLIRKDIRKEGGNPNFFKRGHFTS